MGTRTTLSLKLLQWFIRFIQLCCGIVVLAITSYFMASQDNHDLPIHIWERAVEGISGSFIIYTIVCILTLCFFAGLKVIGFLYIILDIAFIGAFIYVAWSYRHGANSCSGNNVETPYDTGPAGENVGEYMHVTGGWMPTFRQACRMEKSCLAVAIIAIIFLLFSILNEFALMRDRKKAASDPATKTGTKKGLFGFRRRNRTNEDPNVLPKPPPPADMEAGTTN